MALNPFGSKPLRPHQKQFSDPLSPELLQMSILLQPVSLDYIFWLIQPNSLTRRRKSYHLGIAAIAVIVKGATMLRMKPLEKAVTSVSEPQYRTITGRVVSIVVAPPNATGV